MSPLASSRRFNHASFSGFSLIEVVIALGLVSFCFIGIIGLLPAGLNQQSNATRSTSATQLAMSVATDLRALATSTSGSTASERFGLTANTNTPQIVFASDTLTPLPSAQGASYRIKCTQVPASSGSMQKQQFHVVVDWPVTSGTNAAVGGGRIETLVALNLFGKL